jgi:hypothetical protein
MEAKAHSRGTYATAGRVSWMEQDLLDCSDDLQSSFKQKPIDGRYSALLRDKHEMLHVCVVGAGFAGLRCAEVLIEEGVQVTILEARNRIGGRVSCPQYETKRTTDKRLQVHQMDLLGHTVDM